jgi:hypothetical protein
MEITTRRVRRTRKALLAGALAASATFIPLVASGTAGATAHPRTPSICSKETPAVVGKALGITIQSSSFATSGTVVLCRYFFGVGKLALVRTETHDNLAGYNNDFKDNKAQGSNPKADPNFKPYPAFSTSLGSPPSGPTYSVVVLKGSTELSISASVPVTLKKLEGLAKSILPAV